MALPRLLGALAALTGLLLACSPASEKPAAEPSPSNTSMDKPAAPVPPACGDVLAAMSTRDKLAQLLMVGVTGADDARAVVDNQHVGGIMIGSWTDLSMMGPPLADIAASASRSSPQNPTVINSAHHNRWVTQPGSPTVSPRRKKAPCGNR